MTTLSGDLGTRDDNSDNAYTVVYGGENIEARIDGLSITGGNADGSFLGFGHDERSSGGGIYSDSGTLTITNSTLSGNSAGYDGGGIYSSFGTLMVTNSTLSGNSANNNGGGIYNFGTLMVTNSTLSANSAVARGGGIYSSSGTLLVTNSTLSANSAGSDGGGLYSGIRNSTQATLNSTIVAGNEVSSGRDINDYLGAVSGFHNLIGDGSGQSALVDGMDGNQVGTSASRIDPMLSDLTQFANGHWGYSPLPGSPAIDAGNNNHLPADTFDLDNDGNTSEPLPIDSAGNPRVFGGTVDIGACEFLEMVNSVGPIDFLLLEHVSLGNGNIYFQMETTHGGTLSLQVDAPKPIKSARLKIYNADPIQTPGLMPLAQSTPDEDGNQRIDRAVASGQTYYVEVFGTNTDFNVRLANLLHHDPVTGSVTVYGTEGDDTFKFDAAASRDININGVRYHFNDAQVRSVNFDGGAGDDTVILDDSIGDDTLRAQEAHAVFSNSDQSPGFTVTVDGFEELQAYARAGGLDRAFLQDSDGNDKFKAEPAKKYAKMYGGRMYNRVKLYEVIEAFSSGENDLARMFDTAGNDTFEGRQEVSWLRTDVFDVGVHNFRRVIAYALEDGRDEATLRDSALRDEVHLKSLKSEIFDLQTGGDVYKIAARRFETVHADGSEGGADDKVKIWETTRDNHVEAADNWARMFDQKAQLEMIYDILAFEFVKVRASTGGNDTSNVTEPLDFELLFEDGWNV